MSNNKQNDEEIRRRSQEAARRAKQFDPSVQFAITVALPNTVNGAFWGFINYDNIRDKYEAIKNSSNNITARRLGNNYCLIEINPPYLIKAVQSIDSEAIRKKDLDIMVQKRAEATVSFAKFLIAKGKEVEKTGKLFANTIGIYCINDTTTIMYKNTPYPAFRVAMKEALVLLDKFGYNVKVNGKYIPASQAFSSGDALWDSTILSPTKTGLFIDIASTLPAERIKDLEREFKAQHKAN